MKQHIRFLFIFCCAILISLAGARATTFQVQVGAGGLKFTPQNVDIHVGDTVQWTWAASGHSTTSGTPGHPDGMWDSGILNLGATFSFTFTSVGTFNYYCSPHGACCGMIGTVSVSEAIDTVQITRAQYATSTMQLTVQATDSNESAMLTVTKTSDGTLIGMLMNKGGGSYSGKFSGISNPQKITVTSNFGGTATAKVKAR
ncbi:MAG TPA: plastocyanin/azurin family copper-binding protein [Chthoniobacterales bacterium]|jgi:plastocyanin|nr:plastocyanin/azurin family copper-binding protein [Chthoniobacterales bacterium]